MVRTELNDIEKFDPKSDPIRLAVRLHLEKHRYAIPNQMSSILISKGNASESEPSRYNDHFTGVSCKIDEIDLTITENSQLTLEADAKINEIIHELGKRLKKRMLENVTDSTFHMYSSVDSS